MICWGLLGLTFICSCAAIWLLAGPAREWHLVDHPGGRKRHKGHVPLIGGLGIFCALLVGSFFVPGFWPRYLPYVLGSAMLLLCGMVDDVYDLSSGVKLFFQLLAAAFMASWANVTLDNLGNLVGLGPVMLGNWQVPITMFCVVGLINAVNMMDGIDGLAGGYALISAFWLGLMAWWQGAMPALALFVMLAGASAGFLVYNLRHPLRRRASIFLGDSGSMLLGYTLAWFAVELVTSVKQGNGGSAISPVSVLWVLALPVIDTLGLMIQRLKKHQSPFVADRQHLHHIFQRAGFSSCGTTLSLLAVTALMGAVGFFGHIASIPDILLFLPILLVVALYAYFINRAWRTMKKLRRLARWRLAAPGRSRRLKTAFWF